MWQILGWYMTSRLKSPNFDLDKSFHKWGGMQCDGFIKEIKDLNTIFIQPTPLHILVIKKLETDNIRYYKWDQTKEKYTRFSEEEILFRAI